MTAVRNHVAVPFFDRVPPRVKDIQITTFDNIVERAQSQRDAYHFFANAVKKRNVEGPTFAEFADWHERVKDGLIERPHPSDVPVLQPMSAISERQRPSGALNYVVNAASGKPYDPREKGPEERLCKSFERALSRYLAHDTSDVDAQRLKHARGIVKAAHELNLAKIAAGFSPVHITLDDTIVQEALREVLSAEADATVMDTDTHMTPGNKLVDLLLGADDDDIDGKLVDCLTIDMQAEICALLVKRMAKPLLSNSCPTCTGREGQMVAVPMKQP